jgi:hypothetical protein
MASELPLHRQEVQQYLHFGNRAWFLLARNLCLESGLDKLSLGTPAFGVLQRVNAAIGHTEDQRLRQDLPAEFELRSGSHTSHPEFRQCRPFEILSRAALALDA